MSIRVASDLYCTLTQSQECTSINNTTLHNCIINGIRYSAHGDHAGGKRDRSIYAHAQKTSIPQKEARPLPLLQCSERISGQRNTVRHIQDLHDADSIHIYKLRIRIETIFHVGNMLMKLCSTVMSVIRVMVWISTVESKMVSIVSN